LFLRRVVIVAGFWLLLTFSFFGQALAGEAAYLGYRVKPGDTLWLLAQRYGTSVAEIQALNKVGTSLNAGQFLYLPVEQQGDAVVYRVQPGDTLYLIAQRHGQEVAAIKAASGLSTDLLYPGQRLLVPIAAAGYRPYRGAAGDTLFLLAQRFSTTPEVLRQINGLASDLLLQGQLLQLPADRTATADRGAGERFPAPPPPQ